MFARRRLSACLQFEWRTNQLYMAHFTVTDVEERFYQAQRFSRGAAGLAGAAFEPRYRVCSKTGGIRTG